MLVLTRREREGIIVQVGSTKVVVKVIRVSGDRVRLGFEAPENVSVVRDELPIREKHRVRQ